jgi:hypothetical protein
MRMRTPNWSRTKTTKRLFSGTKPAANAAGFVSGGRTARPVVPVAFHAAGAATHASRTSRVVGEMPCHRVIDIARWNHAARRTWRRVGDGISSAARDAIESIATASVTVDAMAEGDAPGMGGFVLRSFRGPFPDYAIGRFANG